MQRIVLTIAMSILSFNLLAAEKPASSFSLKDLHGRDVEFKPGHAKTVVVLNFWASWCSSCLGEIPELVALKKANPEATFYGINEGENSTKAQRFLDRSKYPYTILLDEKEEVGAKYEVDNLPQTIVIDKSGKVTFRGPRPPQKL